MLGIFYAFMFPSLVTSGRSVEVATLAGRVRGEVETSTREGTSYAIFYGVPYAAPPVGERRLLPPEPVEPWDGLYDNSASMSSVCLQREALPWQVVSEDCLYLTLATPALDGDNILTNASLPVMVWIQGGSWTMGSGGPVVYNPDLFMDKGVVHVGVNYRLGALGFLALEGETGGNQGLRDQGMALLWVRDNIREFGGDPDKVTCLGSLLGAGASSYSLFRPFLLDLCIEPLHKVEQTLDQDRTTVQELRKEPGKLVDAWPRGVGAPVKQAAYSHVYRT